MEERGGLDLMWRCLAATCWRGAVYEATVEFAVVAEAIGVNVGRPIEDPKSRSIKHVPALGVRVGRTRASPYVHDMGGDGRLDLCATALSCGETPWNLR